MKSELTEEVINSTFFGGIHISDFRRQYFRRKILHKSSEGSPLFTNLFSTEDFDALLNRQILHRPAIRMIKEGVILPMSDICYNIPYGKFSFENVVDIRKVKRWFDSGYTINVRGGHLYNEKLKNISNLVGRALGCKVRANLYLTPPQKTGLAPHHDMHDVIVIQLKGTKNWKIHSNRVASFIRNEANSTDAHDVGTTMVNIKMRAGDFLYIPAGTPHSAVSNADESSLHLTLGIEEPKVIDLVEKIVESLADTPEMRRALFEIIDFEAKFPTEEDVQAIRSSIFSLISPAMVRKNVEKLLNENSCEPEVTDISFWEEKPRPL